MITKIILLQPDEFVSFGAHTRPQGHSTADRTYPRTFGIGIVKDGEEFELPRFFSHNSITIADNEIDLEAPNLSTDEINEAFNFIRCAFEGSDEYDSKWLDYILALLRHKSMNAKLEFSSNLPFIVCIYFAYVGEGEVIEEFYRLGFFNRYRHPNPPQNTPKHLEVFISGREPCLDLIVNAAYKYFHELLQAWLSNDSLHPFGKES